MGTVISLGRDLHRTTNAFDRPTLRMLNHPQAPYVIAIFSTLLPAERARIPAEAFHIKVDGLLEDLQASDPKAPSGLARELCTRWVKQQWLSRAPNEAGEEEYSLTSHTQEAIEFIDRMSGRRAVLGESRIRTIIEATQRFAGIANPDPAERIRRQRERVAREQGELERLEAGGATEAPTLDQLFDEYRNLEGLLSALPSDFLRVTESMREIRRDISADLRAEQSSLGDILDAYLKRADGLMEGSLEGRAFRGAVDLLRDQSHLEQLQADLMAILRHEFATALTAQEREGLANTVSLLRRGIATVTQERSRMSTSLARSIERHDVVRERELNEVLTSIDTMLHLWMRPGGGRKPAKVDLGLEKCEYGNLSTRFYDPAEHAPPPPLRTTSHESAVDVWAQARGMGGPDLRTLRETVEKARGNDASGELTAAEVFRGLDDGLRRPVEILGLLHVSSTAQPLQSHPDIRERYVSRRADGTERVFTGPALRLNADSAAAASQAVEQPAPPPGDADSASQAPPGPNALSPDTTGPDAPGHRPTDPTASVPA